VSEAVNNFFLVIEGLDGSGKTEISRRLQQTLQGTHHSEVELTFEPHDPSAAGQFIRDVLAKKIKTTDRTLALAFALNRADHNDRLINPFLDAGQQRILICDRYYLSSLVYQSTLEITMEQVLLLNEGARRPDLIIFLDASAETCYTRMSKRPQDRELFERNLEATRQKYLQAMDFLRQRGEIVLEVNADGDRHSVFNALLDTLTKHGPSWLQPLANFAADEPK
jgi:dTMP kinase